MSEKNVLIGDKEISSIGRFRLDWTGDKKKFTMSNLYSIVPYGKQPKDRIYFHAESGQIPHFFINKSSLSFKPDENEIDRMNVTTLIQHPEVKIAQMSDKDYQELVKLKLKKSNPKFVLTNIDKVDDDTYDRENELILARAMLRATDNNRLTKKKMIWLCSKFGISYRTDILDSERYQKFLIKQLDSFLMKGNESYRTSKLAIQAFTNSLKDIKRTEYIYYLNEFKNLQIITDIGGMFKIGERPVGADYDSLINYYEQNQDMFNLHKADVEKSIKGTIME